MGAMASISMSSGRRWADADAADEGPPSEDQSIWKLVVADEAEGGLDRSLLAEGGTRTLLTDKEAGAGRPDRERAEC